MKKILLSLFGFMLMFAGNVMAQEQEPEVTIDLTTNDVWAFPTDYVKTEASYTNNGVTLTFAAASNGHKYNSNDKYVIFGKKDAAVTLSAFEFDVERIDVIGRTGASGKITFNIFVGEESVSTEVTGATGTANFLIAEGKQAAGTIYTIKNTNDNNNQITKILVWKKGTSGQVPHIENTAETAYTVAEAVQIIDKGEALSETVFVKGIISQIDSYNDTYKSITYWISDDGTTEKQFEVYSGKGLNGADFTSIDDLKIGATVIVKGKIKKYGDIYEFDKSNELASYDESTATGIAAVKETIKTAEIFNAEGQQLAAPQKGLNIIGGKKIWVK